MRLSTPEEDESGVPEGVESEESEGEPMVEVSGEEMPITEAVEMNDATLAEAFEMLANQKRVEQLEERVDRQEEAIKELQEGIEDVAGILGQQIGDPIEGRYLDEEVVLE